MLIISELQMAKGSSKRNKDKDFSSKVLFSFCQRSPDKRGGVDMCNPVLTRNF